MIYLDTRDLLRHVVYFDSYVNYLDNCDLLITATLYHTEWQRHIETNLCPGQYSTSNFVRHHCRTFVRVLYRCKSIIIIIIIIIIMAYLDNCDLLVWLTTVTTVIYLM